MIISKNYAEVGFYNVFRIITYRWNSFSREANIYLDQILL